MRVVWQCSGPDLWLTCCRTCAAGLPSCKQDDGIGDSLPTALKLCSSNASTCVSTNGSTLATAHGMVSTSRKGGADAKVFKLPARAGSSLTAAVQVVSPASDIDFKPIPWVLSNLQYTLEILAANGDVVAGPISSTSDLTLGSIALSYSVPSDGVVYIRVKPATVMGQPSTYGVAGAFTLSAQFTSLTEAVICPTTGLPECVYETSGECVAPLQAASMCPALRSLCTIELCAGVVVVPAAGSCTTDDKGFCAAVPNSSATCRCVGSVAHLAAPSSAVTQPNSMLLYLAAGMPTSPALWCAGQPTAPAIWLRPARQRRPPARRMPARPTALQPAPRAATCPRASTRRAVSGRGAGVGLGVHAATATACFSSSHGRAHDCTCHACWCLQACGCSRRKSATEKILQFSATTLRTHPLYAVTLSSPVAKNAASSGSRCRIA